jgi:membrane dipeptidase
MIPDGTQQEGTERRRMKFDAHQEILDEFVYSFILSEAEVVSGKRSVFDEVYLPLLRAQGVKFVNMSVGGDHVAQILYSNSDFRFWDAHKKLDALHTELESGCSSFRICRSQADIEAVLESGEIGIFATMDGGRPLQGKKNLNLLSSLRSLYRLGLRGLQLTGNGRNRLGDGAAQERSSGRLTGFGLQVVHEADRLGILLDSAQLSNHGFYDLIEQTENPVVDSHSCAAAVSAHPRNIGDERIRLIGEKGGVVGISFLAALLAHESPRATTDDLLRHIDHVVETAGIDHVALGPDYSAYTTPACRDRLQGYANIGPNYCDFDRLTPTQSEKYPGWIEGIYYGIRESDYIRGPETHESFPMVEELLSNHGYSGTELEEILGDNMLRVYREILQ